MNKKSCILICHCRAGLLAGETLDQILNSLKTLSVDLIHLHDLCAISLNDQNALKEVAARYDHKILVACYPRAIKYILEQGGLDSGGYRLLNFRELSPGRILEEITGELKSAPVNIDPGFTDAGTEISTAHITGGNNGPYARPEIHSIVTGLNVPAWYPVIDTTRCTLCGKCAKFCLFGVYEFDRKSLKVVNPLSCKNNCPACGRLCPESAIIFPRLAENTSLSGGEPGQEVMSADKENLVDRLDSRNRKRKIIFREDFAVRVRDGHLKALESLKGNTENKN
jgi:NAD-dependent dihydropyrimidine dehydrogenase PreA subunit